jgi:hypothetical protein
MIHKVGPGDLYSVHFLDRTDPGFGHGPGAGTDPGYGRPEWGDHPNQGLPGGGHISNRPPLNPNFPSNSLPSGPPPHLPPGTTLVLVRDPAGVWHYAAIQPGQPVPPPLPDHTLPGGAPPMPGQLPGQTPAPKA